MILIIFIIIIITIIIVAVSNNSNDSNSKSNDDYARGMGQKSPSNNFTPVTSTNTEISPLAPKTF